MSTVKRMKSIEGWVALILLCGILCWIGYVGYVNYTAWDLVGEKIFIDGKELTITASYQGECILSDRTRIHALYAKKLLVGGSHGTDK